MEGIIISIGEPQLGKCIESVKNQIIPFDKVIHIDGVIPISEAFKKGFSQVNTEWVFIIAGDMILNSDATETANKMIQKYKGHNIGAFLFGLFDTFIKKPIKAWLLYRTEAIQSVGIENKLRCDRRFLSKIKNTWSLKRMWEHREIIIGTHFDDPDDFQIFRRFFIVGAKRLNGITDLEELYKNTEDSKYLLAIAANKFGLKHEHPGSINFNYLGKMYERFLDEDINSYSGPK